MTVRRLFAEAAEHDVESCRLNMLAAIEMSDATTAALFAKGVVLAQERAAYWRKETVT